MSVVRLAGAVVVFAGVVFACSDDEQEDGPYWGSHPTPGTSSSSGTSGTTSSSASGSTSGEGGSRAYACTTDCSSCGPLEECHDGKYCVAKMVSIPSPGGGKYRIDAVEVTRCEFAAWLATKPATSGQDDVCKEVSTFEPNADCMKDASCKGDCTATPQVCINLCQAAAYCKGVGKHICGKVGGSGPADFDGFAEASKDQWYNACSGGGQNTFPYADAYEGDACNGYDNPETGCEKTKSCSMRPGGEVASCQSKEAGYGGVYDLSGNVFEWEDSCNQAKGQKDRCRFRGGSYISSYGADNGNALRCNYDIAGARDDQYPNLGFRCCAD